jgi:CRISPR/Cas system-associated endoribonuclease Cas2
MYITPKQCARGLIEAFTDTNTLIHVLQAARVLIKREGKKLQSSVYKNVISTSEPTLLELLQVLHKLNKDNDRDITALISAVKELANDYKSEFVINSHSDQVAKTIGEKLSEGMNVWFIHSKVNKAVTGVQVKGEGMYYKRNVDKDVRELLDL